MGYDCTLHAVDRKQISTVFLNALLANSPSSKASSENLGIESTLWDATRKSLAEDPPEAAASTVCQLALVFASKSLPYHYERGFALSLWPNQPPEVRGRFPGQLTESPERLFAKLVKRHPRLKGHFPTDFSGNWSTGKFVPAKNVAKALQWVEKKVAEFEEGERDLFRGLILTLQYCRKHKLAYWEGTDLPIPMASMPAEGRESRAAKCFEWPDHGYKPLAQRGSLFICEHRLGPAKNSRTAIADFSTWPPKLAWLPEYAIGAAFSHSGRLVTRASVPGETDYQVRVRESPREQPRVQRSACR